MVGKTDGRKMESNVQCIDCKNFKAEWCEKIDDSPNPYVLRNCEHYQIRVESEYPNLCLRECPFCGESEAVHMMIRRGKDGWRDYYYVLCDYNEGGCGASGQWSHYECEAADAWNRRANDG